MQLVITPEESARLDAAATEPVETLMERAGLGVALAAVRLGIGYGSRVMVLAGKGNNGGDGYVAARYLARRGADVVVHSLGFPKGEFSPARKAAAAAVAAGVQVRPLGDPEAADLVIDALFGVGFRGSLPEAVMPWIEAAPPALAVDLPSGLDPMTGTVSVPVLTALRTVTFHALKPGHLLGSGPEVCGPIDVVDIGLAGGAPEFVVCDKQDAPIPRRKRTAHKWSAGSVVVVGGSAGISGAALLTAQSALASGAGSVAVACPAGLQGWYATHSPGVMTRAFGAGTSFDAADAPAVVDYADRFDVMVLGPGLGPGQEAFVRSILGARPKPVVLDADGLNALAGDGVDVLAGRTGATIVTPHAGEFSRLTGHEAGYGEARTLAEKTGSVVVLKGSPTFVAAGDLWAVTSGGPELATIGTGDVLAGMIAALWAAGLSPEVAARSAAYHHGVAGGRLATRRTVTASRLVDEVAEVVV